MPPRTRNHLDPTGPDTPTAIPASSLVIPSAILRQNDRSSSRRIGGRPGDLSAGRPVCVTIHPGCRPINTSTIGVLLRLVEPGQYRAIRYTERLAEAEAVASVGSRGDSYDNAMAEALNSLFKAECIRNPVMRPKGGWKNVTDIEIAVAEYVDWYNHRRLHGEIGLVPPAEFEANHWASITPAHYPETPVPTGAGSK
jgi:hypothetical protein